MKPTKLRVGDSGELVALLHQRLKQLDFKIPQAEIERRFFGPATRQAVRSWQIANKLDPSGVVDPTSELLKSESDAGLDRKLGDLEPLEFARTGGRPARRPNDARDPARSEPDDAAAPATGESPPSNRLSEGVSARVASPGVIDPRTCAQSESLASVPPPLEAAGYTFVPHFRRGLAATIATPDNPADPATAPGGRAAVSAVVTMGWADAAGAQGNTPLRATKALDLVGPADVKTLQPRAILRSYPPDGAREANPGELAFVEFYDEDLPWRYTPAGEVTAVTGGVNGPRLRPWLGLLVLAEGEYTLSRRPDGSPLLTVTDGVLPPPEQNWAWAHAQVAGAVPDFRQAGPQAEAAPDAALSRLLSPRRLVDSTAYAAFVVPAFETGRRAGLGLDPAATPARKGSWGPDNPDRRFPIYHWWRFSTGVDSSFEALVRRLRARAVGAGFGQREMRVDGGALGIGPGELPATVGLEGALQPPDPQRAGYPGEVPGAGAAGLLTSRLDAAALGLLPANQGGESLGEDPIVVPPMYGARHAGVVVLAEVQDDDPVGWVRELNLDPRNRAAAGLGARVVREQQEDLMVRAWAQVGHLRDANQRLREAELALEAASTAFTKHLAGTEAARLLMLTSAAHAGLAAPAPQGFTPGARSIQAAVDASRVPTAAVEDPAFRKVTRPATPLLRRSLPGNTGAGFTTGLVQRMDADADAVSAAPPLPAQPGAVTLDAVAAVAQAAARGTIVQQDDDPKRVFLVLLANLLTTSDGSPPPPIPTRDALIASLRTAIQAWGQQHPAKTQAVADLTALTNAVTAVGPEGAVVRITVSGSAFANAFGDDMAAKAYRGVVVASASPPAGGTVARMTDVAGAQEYTDGVLALSGDLAARLDEVPDPPGPLGDTDRVAGAVLTGMSPSRSVYRRVTAALPGLADHLAAQARITQRRLRPVLAYPTFADPMVEALQALSQDYVLPNIAALPTDTLTLMEPNRRYIEAFLAGLNTEMARELLWREYPTDQRGSYFRVFWDRRDAHPDAPAAQGVDVPPLPDWLSALGANVPPDVAGTAAAAPLVLVMRSDLLHRFPNTVVTAQRAAWTTSQPAQGKRTLDAAAAPLLPLFTASLEPDVALFAFALSKAAARGHVPTGPFDPRPADPGFFFVLSERPGQPRFGLDLTASSDNAGGGGGGDYDTWDDLSWSRLVAPGAQPPTYVDTSANVPAPADPGGATWAATSADLASVLLRSPVMYARHADDMLPREDAQPIGAKEGPA
jgi:peptidoglycan hydrolase-like protein with peptidoglycan-binding domain